MITHLVSSTLVALIAAGMVLMLRQDRAAARHFLLFVAIVRFAIPTSWLRIDALPPIEPMLLHPGPVTTAITRAASAAPAPRRFDWRILWALGTAVCLAGWGRRAFRPVHAIRSPNPEELQRFPGVPLRIVAPGHVPGAGGLFRQFVLLPVGLAEHLTASEMNAVISHEMAHVRRRDNLTAAVAHVVVSAFWFHPLLWWLERRMLDERETACDESVLGRGIGPDEYCAGIAKVCRMSMMAAGYAGANGSNLQKRMEHIMSTKLTPHSSRYLRAAAGVLIAAATVVPLVRAQTAPREAFVAAEQLMKDGQTDAAIARLQQEAAANPRNLDVRLALGNLLVRSGRFEEALRAYEKVLEGISADSKQRADPYLRIGETYRRMGKYPEAIASLEKARALDPNNRTVVLTLALTVDGSGDKQQAMRLYRDVLAHGDNGVALNNLAYVVAETGGSFADAMALARRAQAALPENKEIVDTVGWIYLKAGRGREAVNQFAEAVLANAGERSYRDHLAAALDQTGGDVELRSLLRGASSPEGDARLKELVRNLPR